MPIETNNLVLYKSERLTDTSDGGGKYSGQVVIDGESNNLFPDVSELDRTVGRVSMRKIFAGVNNNDTESLMGSTVFISKNPDDPNVSALLFSTRSHTDTRDSAKSRLEDYLVRGSMAVGSLLDAAYQGMSIVQMIMYKEEKPNVIGDALCLIKNEGKVDEFIQYVRIKRVDTANGYINLSETTRREFKVATYTLEQPLLSTFIGVSPLEWNANKKPQTSVRGTLIADSGNYYASAKLAGNATIGSYGVKAASIFKQLVPVGQSETPMIDLNPNGESVNLVVAGSSNITQSYTINTATGQNLYIGSAIMPSSVSFVLRGEDIVDKGGYLVKADNTQIATIDYQRGLIQWTQSAGSGIATFDLSFKPAAAPLQTMSSQAKPVTEQSMSMNWTGVLMPLPSPTTVRVSYMSQGKFYELHDDGTGKLVAADTSIGVGTINYTTGSWLLTTGALPDVNSIILVQWGTPIATFERSNTAIKPLTFPIELEKEYIKNLTITWLLSGETKTATVSSSGVISGDATGRINMATGKGVLIPKLLPQSNTEFNFEYDWGVSSSQTVGGTITGGTLNLTIGNGTPLTAGGVSITFTVYQKTVTLHDVPIDVTSGNLFNGSNNVGTIDYVTGAVSISAASLPTETYISGYTDTYENVDRYYWVDDN